MHYGESFAQFIFQGSFYLGYMARMYDVNILCTFLFRLRSCNGMKTYYAPLTTMLLHLLNTTYVTTYEHTINSCCRVSEIYGKTFLF